MIAMVAIAVNPGPNVFPKSVPARVTTIYIYFSPTGDLPQLCIYTKLQCNEEKPLNDIPKKKGHDISFMSCLFLL